MKTYQNSDVIKITDLNQRTIVNWAEKRLVVPVVDAQGAGSKREYSYTNLLEFFLCKELFGMGFENYQVRKILDDLREDKDLEKWSRDFKDIIVEEHLDVLAYCFDEKQHKIGTGRYIIPYIEIQENFSYLNTQIINNKGVLYINLTKIKKELDTKLKEYNY